MHSFLRELEKVFNTQRRLTRGECALDIIFSESASPSEWFDKATESLQVSGCSPHTTHPPSDLGAFFFCLWMFLSLLPWSNDFYSGFSISLPFSLIHLPFFLSHHLLFPLFLIKSLYISDFFSDFKSSILVSLLFWRPKEVLDYMFLESVCLFLLILK